MTIDFSAPILIVEDARVTSRIVSGLLRQLGFQHVDVVQGSFTALNRMRVSAYKLVISDWHMKPMSGLDLLKQVRSDDTFADTRFIIMTASSSLDHVLAAKNARC